MLENLKIGPRYDGFLFLADARRNLPRLKSHHHIELELNLVIRGSITYVVGGSRFTFKSRNLLWLYPSQEHQLVDRSDDAQYYVAVFKPSLIADACRGSSYSDLKRKTYKSHDVLQTQLEPESFDLVRKTMDALMMEALDPDILNREAGFGVGSDFSFEHGDPDGLNAGLRHLLLLSWRSQRGGKTHGEYVALHPAVQRALKLLGDDDGRQNLAHLATICGVSSAYLSRTFARQMGVQLNRYRNSLKLARFWEIYRQPPQKNLAEAVYAANFGSYAQFYKVFRQVYGTGPRLAMGATLPHPATVKSSGMATSASRRPSS